MTELLIRLFVKDYNNTKDVSVRTAYGILSGWVGIFCNVFLFAAKLTIGLVIHSISVMSDAFNNLSDAASSVISLAGVHLAEKPADREHPYGHGRIEYIAALVVSFLVLEVGWTFMKTSVGKIRTPETMTFSGISLAILCLSVLVKLWMSAFNRKLGRRINSKIMEATAADSAGDVLATGATILSLLLYGFLHINIDGWIGLAVSLIILWAGIGIARDTLNPLIGEPATEEERQELQAIVERHPGVLGTHDLLVHHYGPTRRMASIHVEMDNRGTLEETHRMADHIERQVQEETGIDLVIHVDPIETHDRDILKHQKLVEECMKEVDPQLAMHDFHMIREEGRDYLYLDLEIPYQVSPKEADHTAAKVMSLVKKRDDNAECTIVVDRT